MIILKNTLCVIQDVKLDYIYTIIKQKGYFTKWVDCSRFTADKLSFVKMVELNKAPVEQDSLVKLYTVTIQKDRQLNVFVLGRKVNVGELGLPCPVHERNINIISERLDQSTICHGLSTTPFIEYLKRRKCEIRNVQGHRSAYLDTTFLGGVSQMDDFPPNGVVRSAQCTMLVPMGEVGTNVCVKCKAYARNLSVMIRRTNPSK